LTVYTLLGRACTVECCVYMQHTCPTKKQYLGVWRADWVFGAPESTVKMSNRQVTLLVATTNLSLIKLRLSGVAAYDPKFRATYLEVIVN
jgi:hypothetical protein